MGMVVSDAYPYLPTPPLDFFGLMYISIFEKNNCNMADFQGRYNGDQIERLLDKANDIDLSKYALKTDNAPTATKLQAARTIALSGAVSGSVSSDFGSNVTISTTLANFDASKITSGTIDIDRLPKAALERMVVVADDTARFKLTTATAQVGDTVKVTATNKMYLVKDDSKLNTEAGYEPYTASSASSVPWSGVTGKPSTFAPPTAAASTLGGVKVGYTTSGKNYKLQVDASGNAFVNVPWTDNNTTYNQATADTLGLVKIGYTSSGKNYAVSLDANGKMYVNVPWTDNNTTYAQATSDKLGLVKIGYSANGKNYPVALDGSGKAYVNVPWTDTNTTYSNMGAATSSAAGKAGLVPAPAAGAQGKYLRGDGTWQTPPNATYNNMGGATSSAAGTSGLVPAPAAGKQASFLRGDGTWATPPNTTYAVANESTNGLMAAADKKTVNRLIGVNTVTTLANLPISKRSITATLSAATTLSVASGMQIGEELMIRCVPSAAFTQAIPNSGAYVSMSGTSITTTANKPFEINIWCYASGKYSIAVKEQD